MCFYKHVSVWCWNKAINGIYLPDTPPPSSRMFLLSWWPKQCPCPWRFGATGSWARARSTQWPSRPHRGRLMGTTPSQSGAKSLSSALRVSNKVRTLERARSEGWRWSKRNWWRRTLKRPANTCHHYKNRLIVSDAPLQHHCNILPE